MSLTIDKDKIIEILRSFHALTKMSVKFFDSNGKFVVQYPTPQTHPFCNYLRNSNDAFTDCSKKYYDYFNMMTAGQKIDVPLTFICQACVLNAFFSINFEDKIYGYVFLRHAREEENRNYLEILESLSKKYNLNYRVLLKKYKSFPTYDLSKLDSAIRILQICLYYFISNQIVAIDEEPLFVDIKKYINSNLSSDLSIESICKKFYVNKNILYALFKKYEGTTVSKYIINKKITLAKNLLLNTNYSNRTISDLLGIENYNYFIIFFKKNAGESPLKYRKKRRS